MSWGFNRSGPMFKCPHCKCSRKNVEGIPVKTVEELGCGFCKMEKKNTCKYIEGEAAFKEHLRVAHNIM